MIKGKTCSESIRIIRNELRNSGFIDQLGELMIG